MAKKKETQNLESDSDELQFRCNNQLPKNSPRLIHQWQNLSQKKNPDGDSILESPRTEERHQLSISMMKQ